MKWIFIDDTNRSQDVDRDSVRIMRQLQRRSDIASFTMNQNAKPNDYDDVRIFDGGLVSSHTGVTIVLRKSYEDLVGTFRAGQEIFVAAGDSDEEKVTIDSFDADTRTITLVAAPAVSLVENDKVGELVYGGTVARVVDTNPKTLDDLEYRVTVTGYDRIFDKKVVIDTWEDVDAQYIINSALITTINLQTTLDDVDYDNNGAIQAAWTESSDGDNPTIDSTNFIEGDAAGIFAWTFSGGTAKFTASGLTTQDISELTGVSSGTPTKGILSAWLETSDHAKITSFKLRIGSSAVNHATITFTLDSKTDFQQLVGELDTATIAGTPDWTAANFAEIEIAETASGSVTINGIRVLAKGSFTMQNMDPTVALDDFRSPQMKPTRLINVLAKGLGRLWYIDYERDIHMNPVETDVAPIEISATSNNYNDFHLEVDVAGLGNRIIVNGGDKLSDSDYAQVFEGDGALREWVLKNKFSGLAVSVDLNASTDTMEAGTTTTNVTAVAHGLVTGDHIVNRSRSNAVRQITKVNDDNFTVEAVTGQTTGDTFSLFVAKTDGIEGITDETTVDFVGNSNEKSVRATDSEATLVAAEFIRFSYKERIPIQVRYTDTASANRLKGLGLGDGRFDLDPITDRNIQDTQTALLYAQARVSEFGNPIINGSFKTNQKGLKAGQVISIVDTVRGIDEEYIIQKVATNYQKGAYGDLPYITVTFGTTLFGWVEFVQKILTDTNRLEHNVDDVVETFITANEEIELAETSTVALGGINPVDITETIETPDTNTVTLTTPPWKYEPSGQALATRYGLSEYS